MNYKTKIAALSLLLAPGLALGQSLAPICKLNNYQPETVSWIPRMPSYFAKITPEGDAAFYIAGGNNMLLLEENVESARNKRIPGDIDPVPCPDGKLMTTPGLDMYEMSEVRSRGTSAPEVLTDWEHSGVYQSCAVLSTNRNHTRYRIITDTDGEVSYRDYDVTYYDHNPADVKPLGRVAKRCPGKNLKTIIISKTGKYLAGYSRDSGTTKIFNIEGSGGTCPEIMDLGYPTGKVEFSYDDSRITFHLDYFRSDVGGYFSGVSSMMTKDVFTLDLVPTNGKLQGRNFRRITTAFNKGSGSYYPSFARDGKLMFINDDKNFFSFHTVKPESVPADDFVVPPPEGWPGGSAPIGVVADWNQRLHTTAIIGTLWAGRCSADGDSISAVEAVSYTLNMPVRTCQSLVREAWTPQKALQLSTDRRFQRDTRFDANKILNMTAGELEASCLNIPQGGSVDPRFYGNKALDNLDGPRAVHHYCVGCHTAGGSLRLDDGSSMPNPIDFDNLEPWMIEASLFRIDLEAVQGRMPPNGFDAPSAGGNHKMIVKDYLQCLLDNSLRGTPPSRSRCD